MYLTGEQPAYADRLINHLQSLPGQLVEGLEPSGPTVEIANLADVYTQLPGNQLYYVESGMLQVWIDGRPVFFLCEGDLLGLRQGVDLPACSYSCDGPVRLRPYARNELFNHIHADPHRQELFTQYLIGQIALLSDALAHLRQPDLRPSTGFQHFAAGEELIHQGDEADNVFIIIEGHAEAFVDGHRVGDVQKDEIFGAMAVFTGEPRSATVVAREPCTVMVIPKEQFVSLMHSNPRIAHSLIESLARRVRLLNQEVTRRIGGSAG